VRLPGADAAQPAGDHDRLVVAAAHAGHVLLEDAEVAAQVGAAELVVEGGAAQRALGHDLQRAGDVRRACRWGRAPRVRRSRQVQVADRKAGQPGLGPRAAAGGAFVADLAAGAGGAPGKGLIAVGWLCVSTFISTCAVGSPRAVGGALVKPCGSQRSTGPPSITAALSL
jgi:hypothetical protein